MFNRTFGGVVGVFAIAGAAHAMPIMDNSVSTLGDVTGGLVALDISGVVSGLTTSNSLTQNFSIPSFSGSLTATVYGNVGAPSPSLNTVVIVYEFVGNGPSGIDAFSFGQGGGANLDFNDLANATHGTIDGLTSVGQASPSVTLNDNSGVPANDTMVFDFAAAGDPLGDVGQTDAFSWYIETDGAVQVGLTNVVVTNFGGTSFDMLTFIESPGQPDLNAIPLPSAAALGLAGLAAVGARRRR